MPCARPAVSDASPITKCAQAGNFLVEARMRIIKEILQFVGVITAGVAVLYTYFWVMGTVMGFVV